MMKCWCSNNLSPDTLEAPSTDCNFPCSGDSSEICGAGSRLSLYNATTPIPLPPTPSSVPTVGEFSFAGCQTEALNGVRALQALEVTSPNMSNELCAASCAGYTMFGTEYGDECKASTPSHRNALT